MQILCPVGIMQRGLRWVKRESGYPCFIKIRSSGGAPGYVLRLVVCYLRLIDYELFKHISENTIDS